MPRLFRAIKRYSVPWRNLAVIRAVGASVDVVVAVVIVVSSGEDAQTGQTSHQPNPGAPRRAVPQARPQAEQEPEAYPLRGTLRILAS